METAHEMHGAGVEGADGDELRLNNGQEAEALARRRPGGPPLSGGQMDLAESLTKGILEIAHARSKFTSFSDVRIDESATPLSIRT